ncbi:MAG: amino acid permease [Proteobacteria bacterium]|nr:amino acid permease [Pseudomonadota bacterium]
MNQNNSSQLVRGLSLMDGFSLVAGTIIGTGIFIKTAAMTQIAGSASYVLLVWVFAGLLSLSGALVYAEIGSIYPEAGGEYVFLREGFGTFSAYLYGWTRFLIASPATVAAYAVGAATFMSGAMSLDSFGGVAGVSIAFIIVFTAINCFAISVGGRVQTFLTVLKVVLIVGLAAAFLISSKGSFSNFSSHAPSAGGWPGWSAFGAAMLAALWAYDGWNNMPMVAGEMKDPKRTIPRSLILGMAAVLGVYALANLSYFYILPNSEILNSFSDTYPEALPVATKAAQLIMGNLGVSVLSILFVISALGAMNGSVMTGARVPFAMAEDGLFPKILNRVSEKSKVPVISVVVQGVVSCIFAASGKFDQLTNYVVFSSWIFYALVTAALFKFRKMHPNHDGYKVWGYPWMPIVFIIVATFLLINTVYTSPKDSLIGLGVIAAGIPFYFVFKSRQKA